MASISFLARLANLWRGFLSLWIRDVEKNHPEVAYENAINSLTEKYAELKHATAAIIRRRDEIRHRLEGERRELARARQDLEAALDTDQDDLAMILIQKQEAVESVIGELEQEARQAENDAEEAKAALLNVKSEIDKLRAEKNRMLARMQSAQARLKIQEQLDGLSVDAEVQALDGVRQYVRDIVAEADLAKEIQHSDLDARLAELRRQGRSVSAKAKLETLKKARQADARQLANRSL